MANVQGITAELIFDELKKAIAADPSLISKVGGVIVFNVSGKIWTVDLKNAPGSVKQGAVEKPDVTITIAEADYANLMLGGTTGQNLFMQGKLKIQGNMGLALKLDKIPKVRAEDAAPKAAAAPSGGAVGAAQVFEVSEFVTCFIDHYVRNLQRESPLTNL
jgi:hypothetical protein